MSNTAKKWDVFISHASEDKDTFIRPLAIALKSLGISVWYDEFSLELGDSISRSIDKGLSESAYGLVVISPPFVRVKLGVRLAILLFKKLPSATTSLHRMT
jgi:hypothetical protein